MVKLWFYDLKENIIKNKKYMLVPVLSLFICLDFYRGMGMLGGTSFHLGDVLFYFFCGEDPISLQRENIIFPIIWISIFSVFLYIQMDYAEKGLSEIGLQMILRCRSRKRWWIVKNVNLFISSIYFVLLLVASVVVFCLLTRASLDLNLTFDLFTTMSSSQVFEMMDYPDGTVPVQIFVLFIFPVLVIWALNAILHCLCVAWNSTGGFIVCNGLLLITAYVKCDYFFIQHSMFKMSSYCIVEGYKTSVGIIENLGVVFASFIIGYLLFQKKSILKKEDN